MLDPSPQITYASADPDRTSIGHTHIIIIQSLTNRFNYNVQTVPGLAFSVSDTRNKGKDALQNSTLNDATQLVTSYTTPNVSDALIGLVDLKSLEYRNTTTELASDLGEI